MCAAPVRPALGSWAACRPVAEFVEAQARSQSVLGQGTVSMASLRQAHSQSVLGQGSVVALVALLPVAALRQARSQSFLGQGARQGAKRRRRRAIPAESTPGQAEIESSRLRSVK